MAVILLTACRTAFAEQDSDNNPANGLNVTVQLAHRVIIPKILYFRVGSSALNSVDEVVIDLSATPGLTPGDNNTLTSPTIPLGNSTPIAASSNGVLTVEVRSNVGAVNISYSVSNVLGLVGDNGAYLPYDQIATQTSNADLPAPVLANAGAAPGSPNSVDITGNLFGGKVVNRQGTWTYSFRNDITPLAGTYLGRVLYTASAP